MSKKKLIFLVFFLIHLFNPFCLATKFIAQAKPIFVAALDFNSFSKYKINETVCLKHTRWTIACGKIRSISTQKMYVEVLKIFPIERVSHKTAANLSFLLGEKVTEHSILEFRFLESKYRSPASIDKNSIPKTRSGNKATVQSAYQPMFFGVGIDYMFPFLKYQYPIIPKLSIGFQASLVNYPLPQGKDLSAYGSQLTFNYYHEGLYRGLWTEFGIGALFCKQKTNVSDRVTPSVMAHLGYRWRWPSGPSFGFAAGAQYIVNAEEFSGLLPSISVDIGFLF